MHFTHIGQTQISLMCRHVRAYEKETLNVTLHLAKTKNICYTNILEPSERQQRF